MSKTTAVFNLHVDLREAAARYLNALADDMPKINEAIAADFATWGLEALDNLIVEARAMVQTMAEEYRKAELKYSGLEEIDA